MNTNKNSYISEKMLLMFIYAFILAFTAICFLPFYLVYINSFADEGLIAGGLRLFPTKFSLEAYKYLLEGGQIIRSFTISAVVTAIGTTLSVIITSMYGYVCSHRKIKYRNFLSFYVYFTMLFGPGLVGYYLLVSKWLGLKNNFLALLVPGLFSAWNAFLFASYFRNNPYEIYESAVVDGANDVYIFFKIIWPISMPVIATVILFEALKYWNDWFNAMLFIDDDRNHPLQMLIRRIMANTEVANNSGYMPESAAVPTHGIQLATVCITLGPIVLLYPFLQKYFITGITIGAVKG